MVVKDLIAELQKYNPEAVIAVAFWDKNFMEAHTGLEPSDANWENAVSSFQNDEWHWQGSSFDTLATLIEEEIEKDLAEDPDIIASSGDGDTLRLL